MIVLDRTTKLAAIAACLLAWLTWGDPAHAQGKKLVGSGKAGAVLSETKMLPGDDPKHELTLARRLDVQRDDLVGDAQVSVLAISDLVAGNGANRGYRAVTAADGDKTFAGYEGTTKTAMKAGGPPDVTFEGKWWFIGGTGKFSGLTGSGTYRGQLTPAGVTYEYEGQYEIRK